MFAFPTAVHDSATGAVYDFAAVYHAAAAGDAVHTATAAHDDPTAAHDDPEAGYDAAAADDA